MVTHDIGLKNFAHRVVRMLDGKIHKIEEYSLESRMEYINALEEVVNEHLENDRVGGGAIGVREGKIILSLFFLNALFRNKKERRSGRRTS